MKQDLLKKSVIKTGRPRAFDESEALNKAMLAFWRHGYESTSMSVLSDAMGMNAPSIYAAYGDKKKLFLKALDIYVGDLDELKSFVDQAPSAFDAASEMLRASAILFTGAQTPRGCMLASATASCSTEAASVQVVAAKKRSIIENIICSRIEKDISNKILPKTTSASALAGLTISVIQGMSVLARDGASRNKLISIVDSVMSAWNVR